MAAEIGTFYLDSNSIRNNPNLAFAMSQFINTTLVPVDNNGRYLPKVVDAFTLPMIAASLGLALGVDRQIALTFAAGVLVGKLSNLMNTKTVSDPPISVKIGAPQNIKDL